MTEEVCAVPQLIRFEISRDEIVSGAVKTVLSRLYPLTDTREHILEYREGVSLVLPGDLEGYGAMSASQAPGLFLQKICQDWPHWIWFLNRDDESLPRFMELVCGSGVLQRRNGQNCIEETILPKRRIRIRLQNLIERSEWLLADYKLPLQLVQKSRESALKKLGLSTSPAE